MFTSTDVEKYVEMMESNDPTRMIHGAWNLLLISKKHPTLLQNFVEEIVSIMKLYRTHNNHTASMDDFRIRHGIQHISCCMMNIAKFDSKLVEKHKDFFESAIYDVNFLMSDELTREYLEKIVNMLN